MPHFTLSKGANGSIEVEQVNLHEGLPSKEELFHQELDEKERVRMEEVATRIISKQDIADKNGVVNLDLKCNHCDFLAGSPQGLTSHIRNKHRDVIVTDSQ